MWRNIASNALTLLVVVLIGLGGLLAWGQNEFTSAGPLERGICLRVDRGASVADVSRQLVDSGAITRPMIFRLGAQYTEKAEQLKFGSYLVPSGASMQDILEAITRGGANTCGAEVNFRIGVNSHELILREVDPATGRFEEVADFVPGVDEPVPAYDRAVAQGGLRYRVTLAEGVTGWQVVTALSSADFLTGQVNEVPPEGRLAPGSYEMERDDARADVLAKMAARQERILADLWAARAEGLPYDSPEQALIMASIVEKETGVAAERPTVASVFVNRLRQGMRLQTDPTVIYGITNGKGVLGRGLRQSELRRATPYNTYVIDGLPPTPIANPGRESIAAALDPAETDFLYFVADGTGGHVFAKTLAEHNRNVAQWRRIEAERAREQIGPPQSAPERD